MTFPQLRVRTEFDFGRTFGPLNRVATSLQAMGCPAAAIVDAGTWGHVKWAKACAKRGIQPLFGVEVTIPQPDGRKPAAWVLGTEAAGFYQFSTALLQPEADPVALLRQYAASLVRFAGAAVDLPPDCFDYVDISPSSPLAAQRSLRLAEATGKPIVLTSLNAFPRPEDRSAYLACVDREQIVPQHLLTEDEAFDAFVAEAGGELITKHEWFKALTHMELIIAACFKTLPVAPLIKVDGDLRSLALQGVAERVRLGHIAEWTDEYQQRFDRELAMIASKQYESYFIVVADLVRWAKRHMLVGPARGSSAGSLVCYCLRITEVDPLVHELLFERFIDVTRDDLPDIDIDFNDQKRELVFDYLADKYGRDKVSRIGNINTFKPKSVMAKVCKKLGIPDKEKYDVLNVLIEYSSGDSRYGKGLEDTMANTEYGRRFSTKYPEARIMTLIENHASHSGVHAAGVIVCNDPVSNYCTVNADGVAQIDKPDAEALNLLKIDALGLRTLGVIEDSGVVTADELYALKLDDPEVLKVFNDHRFAGIFQFEGESQRRVAIQVDIKSFKQIDHCTALARPGPLGGGASEHYIRRASDREEIEYRHPSMSAYLAATMGVVLYQEQVMRIVREIGQFSWEDTTAIRKAMSGRKGKEYFDQRGAEFTKGAAAQGISEEVAHTIWNEICTFGAWGMNASHTVSYGIISYWCAWMKRYHPLEYAAACVRNAKDEQQALEILRDIVREGVKYVAFDIDRSDVNWSTVDGMLVGGFMNLKGIGPAKATALVEARNNGTLTQAQREKLLATECAFAELYPLATQWGALYADPEAFGCAAGSVVQKVDEFVDGTDILWLCQVTRTELRDENETIRVARRNGKVVKGQSLFLDIFATDDTSAPMTLRVDRFQFDELGQRAHSNLKPGDVLLVRGRKLSNFSIIKVHRLKCMNNPEALRGPV